MSARFGQWLGSDEQQRSKSWFRLFLFSAFFLSRSEKLSNNKFVKSKGFKTLLGWATRAALFRTALIQTESEPSRGAMRLKVAMISILSKE
jgi:hypothetical protein